MRTHRALWQPRSGHWSHFCAGDSLEGECAKRRTVKDAAVQFTCEHDVDQSTQLAFERSPFFWSLKFLYEIYSKTSSRPPPPPCWTLQHLSPLPSLPVVWSPCPAVSFRPTVSFELHYFAVPVARTSRRIALWHFTFLLF